jgi:hypothetical protein
MPHALFLVVPLSPLALILIAPPKIDRAPKSYSSLEASIGSPTRPMSLVASPNLAVPQKSSQLSLLDRPARAPILDISPLVRPFLSPLVIALSTLQYHTTLVRHHWQPMATLPSKMLVESKRLSTQ